MYCCGVWRLQPLLTCFYFLNYTLTSQSLQTSTFYVISNLFLLFYYIRQNLPLCYVWHILFARLFFLLFSPFTRQQNFNTSNDHHHHQCYHRRLMLIINGFDDVNDDSLQCRVLNSNVVVQKTTTTKTNEKRIQTRGMSQARICSSFLAIPFGNVFLICMPVTCIFCLSLLIATTATCCVFV